jgi:hypothetical protein
MIDMHMVQKWCRWRIIVEKIQALLEAFTHVVPRYETKHVNYHRYFVGSDQ